MTTTQARRRAGTWVSARRRVVLLLLLGIVVLVGTGTAWHRGNADPTDGNLPRGSVTYP
jgi:hypothetical protein